MSVDIAQFVHQGALCSIPVDNKCSEPLKRIKQPSWRV